MIRHFVFLVTASTLWGGLAHGADVPICFRLNATGSCVEAAQLRSQHGINLIRFQPGATGVAGPQGRTYAWGYVDAGQTLNLHVTTQALPSGSSLTSFLQLACDRARAAGIACHVNLWSGTWKNYNSRQPLYGVPLVFREEDRNPSAGEFSASFACKDETSSPVKIRYECTGRFESRIEPQYLAGDFEIRLISSCQERERTPLGTETGLIPCPFGLSSLPFVSATFHVSGPTRLVNSILAADQEFHLAQP